MTATATQITDQEVQAKAETSYAEWRQQLAERLSDLPVEAAPPLKEEQQAEMIEARARDRASFLALWDDVGGPPPEVRDEESRNPMMRRAWQIYDQRKAFAVRAQEPKQTARLSTG